jgi:ABC-type bacteriocin/lantibiotic exporter with double-glycine peptidase domain
MKSIHNNLNSSKLDCLSIIWLLAILLYTKPSFCQVAVTYLIHFILFINIFSENFQKCYEKMVHNVNSAVYDVGEYNGLRSKTAHPNVGEGAVGMKRSGMT